MTRTARLTAYKLKIGDRFIVEHPNHWRTYVNIRTYPYRGEVHDWKKNYFEANVGETFLVVGKSPTMPDDKGTKFFNLELMTKTGEIRLLRVHLRSALNLQFTKNLRLCG
jgi:hypothetical protein